MSMTGMLLHKHQCRPVLVGLSLEHLSTAPCCTFQVSGEITYNGYHFDEFVVARTAAYVDQNSSHIAEMTVRETLDFAARVQGGGHGALRSTSTVACAVICFVGTLPLYRLTRRLARTISCPHHTAMAGVDVTAVGVHRHLARGVVLWVWQSRLVGTVQYLQRNPIAAAVGLKPTTCLII